MRKAKRGGDDLSRSIRKIDWVSGHFPVDPTQDVWDGLSDELKSYLSKSVASITLLHGETTLFSCSGIAMERQGSNIRFLTSARLVEFLNGANRDDDELKIEVRHEGNKVRMGYMDEYDLDRNFAVVSVSGFRDAQVGPFQHALEILPHGEVLVAVGRRASGEIMAKRVELNGDLGVYEDDEDLNFKNSEAWEGGPVLFVDHVVGMILFLTSRRAIFKPFGTILKHLEHCWTSQQKKSGLAQSKMSKVFRFGGKPMGEKSITYPHTVQGYYVKKDLLDLDSDGYPKLPSAMLGKGMILVNTFEDIFGDIRGPLDQGVWCKLSKRASNIDRNVVALASFNGEKRFFACSGFFVAQNECTIILTSASLVRNSGDDNKIVENLRIEVKLPDKRRREGTLQHYNLHYNVALVSVKDCRAVRPLNTGVATDYCEVAAVGRCFKSGALMATSGDMVNWSGTLDCEFLRRSTCKISKVGIGGPLVNLDGNIVGMNFYDRRIGTPYLAWTDITTILSWFDANSKPDEVVNDSDPSGANSKPDEVVNDSDPSGAPSWKIVRDVKGVLNRWPVPMPHWRHPDFVDEDKSDDELASAPRSGRNRGYTYRWGVKYWLM